MSAGQGFADGWEAGKGAGLPIVGPLLGGIVGLFAGGIKGPNEKRADIAQQVAQPNMGKGPKKKKTGNDLPLPLILGGLLAVAIIVSD